MFYQTDASLSVLGQCEPYGRCATVPRMPGAERLQHYVLLTVLEVDAIEPVHSDARCDDHNAVESYVVDGFQYENVPMSQCTMRHRPTSEVLTISVPRTRCNRFIYV